MALKSLVIDASTNAFQAGILEEDRFVDYRFSDEDTLVGFFAMLTPITKGFQFEEVIFCQGPGKLIGIRATVMFLRVLQIAHPDIKIYSYSNLALAHKIRNPLLLDELQIRDAAQDKKWKNFTKKLSDADELDAIAFKRSLKKEKPVSDSTPSRHHLFEDLVCVRKNRTHYYMYFNEGVALVARDELELQHGPIYCLETNHDELFDSTLIPMKYNLEECGAIIRSIISPNDDVETEFDPQNEYEKWEAVRHR
jgi:hypothetical protein